MNQQTSIDQPKVERKKLDRKYDIHKDGTVVLIETVTTEVIFTGRQFITYMRQHEDGITEMDKQLSESHIKELKKHKTELETLLNPMKPIREQVEKILKEQFEEQKKQHTIGIMKNILNKKEINKNLLGTIWSNVQENQKIDILNALTKDEKKRLLELKLEKMKQERGK